MTRRLLLVNINPDSSELDGCRAIASAFDELGALVTIVHWTELSHAAEPYGVILGPNDTPFQAYPQPFKTFLHWVRDLPHPILGICGGHQALALAHGGELGAVFSANQPVRSYEGFKKHRGCIDVKVQVSSPLTHDMPSTFEVHASHVEEVKVLPPSAFSCLTNTQSPIQGFSVRGRPHYGVQFHPERSAPDAPARRLLRNWLDLACLSAERGPTDQSQLIE